MQATTRPRDHGGLHYQGDKLILGEEDSSVAVDTGTGLTKVCLGRLLTLLYEVFLQMLCLSLQPHKVGFVTGVFR